MVIKCTLSVSLKNIGAFAGKLSKLPPMPGYITRRGPFIHDDIGGDDRIIATYEFDKSKLAEAWEIISKQLDAFHDIPGFSASAHRSIVFSEVDDKQIFRLKDKKLFRIVKKEM